MEIRNINSVDSVKATVPQRSLNYTGAVAFKAAMELGRGMGIRQVRMPQSLLFCRGSAFFFPL